MGKSYVDKLYEAQRKEEEKEQKKQQKEEKKKQKAAKKEQKKQEKEQKEQEKKQKTSKKKETFYNDIKDLHLSLFERENERGNYTSANDRSHSLEHLLKLKKKIEPCLSQCHDFFDNAAKKSKGSKSHLNALKKAINDLWFEMLNLKILPSNEGWKTNFNEKLYKKISSYMSVLIKRLKKTATTTFSDNSKMEDSRVKGKLNELAAELMTTAECFNTYKPK